jgi:hypothetical protein
LAVRRFAAADAALRPAAAAAESDHGRVVGLQRAVRTGSHSQRVVGSGLAVRRSAASDSPLRAAAPDEPLRAAVRDAPSRAAAPDEPLRAAASDAPSREAAADAPLREAAPDAPLRAAVPDAPWQAAARDEPLRAAVLRVGPRPQAVRAFLAPGQTSPRSPQPSKRQEEML